MKNNSTPIGRFSATFDPFCIIWMVLLLNVLNPVSALSQVTTVTVYPSENPKAVSNPGIGLRHSGSVSYTNRKLYTGVTKGYINWADYENSATEDISKITTAISSNWGAAPGVNARLNPRIFLHYWSPANTAPAHMQPLDYSSNKTKVDVERVIRKIGKAWDRDPRIFAIETGILCTWGEQEQYLPYNVSYAGLHPANDHDEIQALPGYVKGMMDKDMPNGVRWEKIMSDAFSEHFHNKIPMVRNLDDWAEHGNDYPFGNYWDLYASPNQYKGVYYALKEFGDGALSKEERDANPFLKAITPPKRYLEAPMVGEMDFKIYKQQSFDPANKLWIGANVAEMLGNTTYSNRFVNYVKSIHTSAVNNIDNDGTSTNAQNILKALGYRFHLKEFKVTNGSKAGETIQVSAKIVNLGSAPIYHNYPVEFFLLKNPTDTTPAFRSTIVGIDIRDWHPGADLNWDPMTATEDKIYDYSTPAKENLISATITLPSTLSGDYLAGISMIEPSTGKPAVYFAIPNFYVNSQTQPLCRIGVGTPAATTAISNSGSTAFSEFSLANDKRNYSLSYYSSLPDVTVSATQPIASEPSTSGQFTFTRTGVTTLPLTVYFKVEGTAAQGADFQTLPNYVVIPKGQSSISMNLNVVDNTIMDRRDKSVVVKLKTSYDYYLNAIKSATVTIKDDFDIDSSLGNIIPLGKWVKGASRAKEYGSNRALVVMLHARNHKADGEKAFPVITFGGKQMTKVVTAISADYRGYFYSGAYVLREDLIREASGTETIPSTIQATWSSAAPGSVEFRSAFFANVDQASLIGDSKLFGSKFKSGADDNQSFATPPLTNVGVSDLVVLGGSLMGNSAVSAHSTTENKPYLLENGFIRDSGHLGVSSDLFTVYGYKTVTEGDKNPLTGVYSVNPKVTLQVKQLMSMVAFVLKSRGRSFDNWKYAYQLASPNDSATADFDNDGMSNMMEYALGNNPRQSEPNPVNMGQITIKNVTSGKDEKFLRISVNRDSTMFNNVKISALVTSDLSDPKSWSTADTVILEDSASVFMVRDKVALEDANKRFMKLRFTEIK